MKPQVGWSGRTTDTPGSQSATRPWIAADSHRCAAAKIPVEERTHRTKAELALEVVDAAVANGLRFGLVGFDGGYGHLPWFLRAVADRGLRFVAEVHANQHLYLSDPCPCLSCREQPRGRKVTRLRARGESVEIRNVFAEMPGPLWRRISIRASAKGTLEVQAVRQRVWLWDGQEKQARQWWAVCTRRRSVRNFAPFRTSCPNRMARISPSSTLDGRMGRICLCRC